jgi:nucleoside-diphosphate-sugar epimerase
MRVFVTGVSGFVGTGLVQYLSASGDYVLFGQTRDVKKTAEKFKNHKIELFDRCSAELFNELAIDSVIHLAGIAHDLSNKFARADYEQVNFQNTKLLFTEFARSNASKFIFQSSIKASVDTSATPVSEENAAVPTSEYGKSKRKAEEFILDYSLPASKHAYILRPCMIHGKGNKGNLNSLYKYVKRGLPYIFGSYANRRSFLSADNLNFVIGEFLSNTFPSGVYHVADDEPLSTNELVTITASVLGRKPRIWNISRTLIDSFAEVGSSFGLPFGDMKRKLTEDLLVSTSKLRTTIRKPLPVRARQGLMETLRSFNK